MEKQEETHYNSFVAKTGNIVWAGALSLAWTQMKNQFVKEPIRLNVKSDLGKKIINNFNNSAFSIEDISSENIYVKSGYGMQTLKTINKEVKQKFKEKTFKDLEYQLTDTDIISYAYIFKKLNFLNIFEREDNNEFLFNKKLVKHFFAKTKDQKKQVIVYNYENEQNFTVSIKSQNPKDLIFLIKSDKKLGVGDAINLVQKHESNKNEEPLTTRDKFIMPIIELDYQHRVEELVGASFENASMNNYFLAEILEAIKLNIDQSGAKIENQGVVIASRCAMIMISEDKPKQIILDKSFWIVMKEANHHPYACFYIVDPIDK